MKHLRIPLLFLLVTSCYFEPDGEFIAKPAIPDYDAVTLDLESLGDTILITDYTQIDYNYANYPSAAGLLDVVATIDGTPVHHGGLSGSIYIDPFAFGTGAHKFKIEAISRSGSGSLADRMSEEIVKVTHEIVAIIEVDLPPPALITSIDSLNGKLSIHWTPYSKANFNSYAIIKYCYPNNWSEPTQCIEPIVITDSTVTTWTDDYFVGGTVAYRVDVLASHRNAYGHARRYEYAPTVSFEIVDKKAVIHWAKPKFYASTSAVTLSNVVSGSNETFTDTVYQTGFTPGVGSTDGRFQVTYHSDDARYSYTFPVPVYIGEYHFYPEVAPYVYNASVSRYYGVDHINGPQLLASDEHLHYIPLNNTWNFNVPFGYMSENGSYLLGYLYNDPERKMYRLDPETLAPFAPFSLAQQYGGTDNGSLEFVPSPIALRFELSIGNNGFIALKTMSGSHVLSLPDFHEIYSAPFSNGRFLISATGDYLLHEDKIYAYNGTTFVVHGSVNTTGLRDVLFDKNDNLILSYADNTVRIVNISNLTVARTINVPLTDFYTLYDPVGDMLLCGHDTDYCIIKKSTGDLKTFPSTYKLTIANGKVFAPSHAEYYAIDQTFFFEP